MTPLPEGLRKAVEEEKGRCCSKCLSSKYALKGKTKAKFGGICGLTCPCHSTKCLEPECDLIEGHAGFHFNSAQESDDPIKRIINEEKEKMIEILNDKEKRRTVGIDLDSFAERVARAAVARRVAELKDEAMKEYGRGQNDGVQYERGRIMEALEGMKNEHCGLKDCMQAYCANRKAKRSVLSDVQKLISQNK